MNKNTLIFITTLAILATVVSIGTAFEHTSMAQGKEKGIQLDPWLNGYPYRELIEINNTQPRDLNEYQVEINVDTATLIAEGKLQDDCNDIRFTLGDGYTEIPFWIHPGDCNSTSTRIWIKLPKIPANSTTRVYMYYGNGNTVSESNGPATFIRSVDSPHYGTGTSTTSLNGNIYVTVQGVDLGNAQYQPSEIISLDRNLNCVSGTLVESNSAVVNLYAIATDGEYIYTAGGTRSDALLLKLSQDLTPIAGIIYDATPITSTFNSICVMNGRIYAAGEVSSSNDSNALIVEFNAVDLSVIASKEYGSSGDDAYLHVVCDQADNNVFAIGYAKDENYGLVVLYDPNLNVISAKIYGGDNTSKYVFETATLQNRYLYVFGRRSPDGGTSWDPISLKFTADRDLALAPPYVKYYVGTGDRWGTFHGVTQYNGLFYVGGHLDYPDANISDAGLLAIIDSELNIVKMRAMTGDYFEFFAVTEDNNYIYFVGGYGTGFGPMIMKFPPDLNVAFVYRESWPQEEDNLVNPQLSTKPPDYWPIYISNITSKNVTATITDAFTEIYTEDLATALQAYGESCDTYFTDIYYRRYYPPDPTVTKSAPETLVTQIGGPTNWVWATPKDGNLVRTGAPTSWEWVTFTDDGRGIVVPAGGPTSWEWYP